MIGYSPEATTPGTGLLLARDTGAVVAAPSGHLLLGPSFGGLGFGVWLGFGLELVQGLGLGYG